MSIPDGDYSLDVSSLLKLYSQDHERESLEIKYGFLPDSMNLESSMKLYQTEDGYLIEGKQTENTSNSIIFEGKEQKQRAGSHMANDSYYILVDPQDKTASFIKINKKIRANKGDNQVKYSHIIEDTEKNKDKYSAGKPNLKPAPQRSQSTKKSNPQVINVPFAVPVASPKSFASLGDSNNTKQKSPEVSNSIITESDFDGLGSDSESDEPAPYQLDHSLKLSVPYSQLSLNDNSITHFEPNAVSEEPKSKLNMANSFTTSKNSLHVSNPSKESIEASISSNMDLDDDFRDLENELDEVLEDSDSDSNTESGSRPISFKSSEFKSRSFDTDKASGYSSQKRPTSLRDLVARKEKEEDQVSEEE